MLILSSEHPHAASCRAFAQREGISLKEFGTSREDSSFLPLVTTPDPLILALPPAALQDALHAWWDADQTSRAPAVICVGQDVDEDALAAAWSRGAEPRSLVALDHNLAHRETLVWALAWGAAVPAFEGVTHARSQGLLGRARTAASALQDLRKEMTGEPAWQLASGAHEPQPSHGGFVWCVAGGVPRVVQEFAHQDAGQTHAHALQWSRWAPVWGEGASVQLRGDGRLLCNGQSRRVRGTDVYYLRQTDALPIAFVGRF